MPQAPQTSPGASHAPRRAGPWRRAWAMPALILGVLPFLTSCNIVAPIAIIVEGPPKYPAQFTLDPQRPTLVLVDDSLNVLPRLSLKQTMATRTQEILLEQGVLKKVVDCDAAYAVTARDREGQVLSVVEVAKAVGADVVVSVTIDSFAGTMDGNDMVLQCAFRVRVLDATKETSPRVWPPADVVEGAGGIAGYRLPTGGKVETSSEALAAQIALAQQTGKAIAQFFFEHVRTDSAAAGK